VFCSGSRWSIVVKTLQNRGQAIWQILGQQPETEMFGGCSVQPDRSSGSQKWIHPFR
jgi:hypothetical protein